ncbi:hypothetical protein [Aquimarina aquimarini]|uniref:hypothetical protein n=1 Tax=Aquimarina aquimarini TaxID=1191734 RepID=UPI001F1A6C1D|nr:hypothetical protein [Aquimarina aquimarini]
MGKSKRIKVEEWLIINKDILKISIIEEKLGYSRGTISKSLKKNKKGKKRTMKIKEINKIDQFIEKVIDSYLQ